MLEIYVDCLIVSDGSVEGLAFQFDESERADVVAYLNKREGKDFAFE